MNHLKLRDVLTTAHARAAIDNPSISREVFVVTYAATQDLSRAVSAALSTFGVGTHGPIIEARRWIYIVTEETRRRYALTSCIPGFGNSFFKTGLDPAFLEVESILKGTPSYDRLLYVQNEICEIKGKLIQINAAGLTACAAEVIGLEPPREMTLAIPGRVAGWCSLV